MESSEWPTPKQDNTEHLFLYPFYDQRSSRRILQDSPQHSKEMNQRRADQIAAKAAVKIVQLAQVYGEDTLPVISMDDPCNLLEALPITMRIRRDGWLDSNKIISLYPVLERDVPSSMSWLGSLELSSHRESDFHIETVRINQPGENQGLELSRFPSDENGRYKDMYTTNPQAMHFIGMVDNYLDRIDQHRLTIVRG